MGFFDFFFDEKKRIRKIYKDLLKVDGSIMIARMPPTFEEFYNWSQREVYIRAYEEAVASIEQPKFQYDSFGSVFDKMCGKCSADDAMSAINLGVEASAAAAENFLKFGESFLVRPLSGLADNAVRDAAVDFQRKMKEEEFETIFDVYGYSAIKHACVLLSLGLTPAESSVSKQFIEITNGVVEKYNVSFIDLIVPFLLERKAMKISTDSEDATLESFKKRVGELQYSTCISTLLVLLARYSGKNVEELYDVFRSCYDEIANDMAKTEANNRGSKAAKSVARSAEELFKNKFDKYGYVMFTEHCAKVRAGVPVENMLFSKIYPDFLNVHRQLVPNLAESDLEVPFLIEKQASGLTSEDEDARINAFLEKIRRDPVEFEMLLHEVFSNIGLERTGHLGVFTTCENIIAEGRRKANSVHRQ